MDTVTVAYATVTVEELRRVQSSEELPPASQLVVAGKMVVEDGGLRFEPLQRFARRGIAPVTWLARELDHVEVARVPNMLAPVVVTAPVQTDGRGVAFCVTVPSRILTALPAAGIAVQPDV